MPDSPFAKSDDLKAFYGTGGALRLWDDKEAWQLRSKAEGSFYLDLLRKLGVQSVLDVSAASGFHSLCLAKAGFDITAVDGFRDFVEAGLQNQVQAGISFPFIECSWKDLCKKPFNGRSFDAAICLGGSLHHTDRQGVRELFLNTAELLVPHGVFVVEQRNYERLFSERPHKSSHPGGWCYTMDYTGPRTIVFHLTDTKRHIDVRFEASITFEQELIPLAQECGFQLLETHYEHGKTEDRNAANWIAYVFRSVS